MTIADLEYLTDVDDFRRTGCNCTWCKKDKGNPNETHGSGAPIVKHPTTGKDTTYRRPSSAGKPLEVDIDSDRYAEYCRGCGDWTRPEPQGHGHVPPKGVVLARYRCQRLTTAVVVKAYRDEGRTPPSEFLRE